MKMWSASSDILILKACKPFVCILKAYNPDNFCKSNWRDIQYSCFFALLATVLILPMPMLIILGIWHLIETDADLKQFSASLPLVLTLLQVEITFIAMIINNRTLSESIAQVQKLTNQRCSESNESHQLYKNIEQCHSKFVSYLVKFLYFIAGLLLAPPAMCPISYAIFDYPPPILCPLPLQSHSLIGRTTYVGFYVDFLVQAIALASDCTILIATISIYVGLFIYINGMVEDMKMRLSTIDLSSLDQSYSSNAWLIYVKEFDFHHEIISVAESLSEVMKVVLFNLTFTCVIVIALNLIVVELNESITEEMVVAIADLITVIQLTFGHFFLAEWITSDLISIGDHFYSSAWFGLLSVKQQKLLVLPIERSQREFHLRGLGLFNCSLMVFASIIRSAGSYYLMIRRFK